MDICVPPVGPLKWQWPLLRLLILLLSFAIEAATEVEAELLVLRFENGFVISPNLFISSASKELSFELDDDDFGAVLSKSFLQDLALKVSEMLEASFCSNELSFDDVSLNELSVDKAFALAACSLVSILPFSVSWESFSSMLWWTTSPLTITQILSCLTF